MTKKSRYLRMTFKPAIFKTGNGEPPCLPPEVISPRSIPPFVPSFQIPHSHQHLTQGSSEGFQQCSFPTQVAPSSQENVFRLNCVAGTALVSRCYGCNEEIKNPPMSIPDDLVIVYRDIRQFRERETGQIRLTATPRNVHFHLRANFIRARYPNLPDASALFVPHDFRPYFQHDHILS